MKKEGKGNKGMIIAAICGVLAAALIVVCVFFPDEFFGLFLK